MNDLNKLSHTTWNCKYHVVFAPKYRRKVFYAQKRYDIGKILRELCKWKQINIIEAEVCPDHVHMTAENERVIVYGISERQKQPDDIRTVEQHQIQVSQQGVPV